MFDFYKVIVAILFLAVVAAISFFWSHLIDKGDKPVNPDSELRPKSATEILEAIERIKKGKRQ